MKMSNKMNEHVNVIIPAYNAAKYLAEAIESVLKQSYKRYDITVVDDGSNDNTAEISKRYGDCVQYVFQTNMGPSSARNRGIISGKGSHVAFIDADDVWIENKLDRQMDLFRTKPWLGMVGCGVYWIDEKGNVSRESGGAKFRSQKELIEQLLVHNVVTGSSSGVVIRRECFSSVGYFDEKLMGSEDRDMWLRISKHYEMELIDEPLVKIRCHNGSATKNIELMKHNIGMFIGKNLQNEKQSTRLKALSYMYLNAARDYCTANNRQLTFNNALNALLNYPMKIYPDDDKYQLLIKSLAPEFAINWLRKIKNHGFEI